MAAVPVLGPIIYFTAMTVRHRAAHPGKPVRGRSRPWPPKRWQRRRGVREAGRVNSVS
ncbi:hypothetical protein [Nesterenkonia pannonica]|uniref:hypothetical protein n=1 Tax=Nesterenkonia pannonica TaxID=1548602 RepID=UPI0021640506|nr:hypothetical protein [Nesterenkonia pannonica]